MLTTYDIRFRCYECGETHPSGFQARLMNTDLTGESYAESLGLRALTPNLEALLEKDDLRCPTTGKTVPSPQIEDLFLGIPT